VLKPDAFINATGQFFDQLVPVATDDQLFAAGYLRGHFDLAVGTLEVAEADFSATDLISQVEQSLQQAVTQGELAPADEQLVRGIWQHIQTLAA
jgi:hypothetical protein